MEKEEDFQQISNEEYAKINEQFASENKEIIDKIERTSNLNESENQINENLNAVPNENENNNLHQQQKELSLNKEDNTKHEIEDLNEEQSLENFNINNNQPSSSRHIKLSKEENNQDVNSTSKLDTLIKSNQNFRELYNMINNNMTNDIMINNNNQINKNSIRNGTKNKKISNLIVDFNQNFNKCNDKYYQEITQSLPFKDKKLKDDNIFDLFPKKLKERHLKQKKTSGVKRKMSDLYDELNKLNEKKYNSKSLGPYPKRINKTIKHDNKKPSHNIVNTKISKDYFKIPKNMTIDDSFYFPKPQKYSQQNTNNQPINKSLVTVRPSLFTSIDKWFEHQSIPQSFYKEKEKTIENLLTSVYGYSVRNDYSNLKKSSFRPSNTKNIKFNSYNNDFYTNKLNSFTLRLNKPMNLIFENNSSQQRNIKGNDKKNYHLFNKQKLILGNNGNNRQIISPFYKSRRINLFKNNTEKQIHPTLLH